MMTNTNVVTKKVPITAYIMFNVHALSFVVCQFEYGVTLNQMYVLY